MSDVGLYGLAVMGQNFALNMASHGFSVCVGNRSQPKVDLTVNRAKAEGNLPLVGSSSVEDFVSKLSKPRKVIILVQAGKPVDATIAALSEYMEEGDLIIDGGNEWFPNSVRRAEELKPKGINFIGMGISGGEEGARNGPSLMPGGPKESYERHAYDMIAPILIKCAAQVDDGACYHCTNPHQVCGSSERRRMRCVGYCGPVGSGNYIKMVHNGIEYGDMQLIGEVYDVLKNIVGMSNLDLAKQFAKWNEGELSSYLIEITAKILAKKDDLTGEGYVVDYILDKTGSKGTGRWTVQEAAEQSVACPTLAAALDCRYISARKEERLRIAEFLKGPTDFPNVAKDQIIEDLEASLYSAKVCSYAQGLALIKAASDANGWGVNLSECAKEQVRFHV
uniref:phosphogluconate dehydrogenase (NADP(+)-dependent, decarboxylating) n=1 Tax=Ditylum brightwellii TaxID=49249 RepID=A0A7S4SDG9_9STRA